MATEDFAFDDEGAMIGGEGGALFKSPYAGAAQRWLPGAGQDMTGMRALPTGDIVYNDCNSGSLILVERDSGERTTVLSGLSNPDGIEVDLDGWVYLAEQAAGSGYGGWDPLSLYVIDVVPTYTYEIPLGVPSKPRAYP